MGFFKAGWKDSLKLPNEVVFFFETPCLRALLASEEWLLCLILTMNSFHFRTKISEQVAHNSVSKYHQEKTCSFAPPQRRYEKRRRVMIAYCGSNDPVVTWAYRYQRGQGFSPSARRTKKCLFTSEGIWVYAMIQHDHRKLRSQ